MGSIGPPTAQRRKIRTTDIDHLTTLLQSTSAKIILPSQEEGPYQTAIARWSSAAIKPAGLVIQPSNSQEVSIAVKYANDNNIELAVKGGGHSTAGASSTDGGLLIYLESLRQVSVEDWPSSESSQSNKVLRVGGGATWGDVDDAGAPYNLHTVGGTVADTGVGGLTLGGGYGWLSGKHGLTIDCLLEAEMVLANGEIVRASRTQNADLFWALSGAGQNFGVVTEFVFRAYEIGDIWAGLLMFPVTPEVVGKVITVINDIYTPDPDTGATKYAGQAMGGLGFMSPPDALGQILMFVSIIWDGTAESGTQAFQPLLDIGPIVNTMGTHPFPYANKFLAPPIGLRSSMKGSAFQLPLTSEFVTDVHDRFATFYKADPADRAATLLMYEFYDPAITISLSGNGCFANRGTHMNALICPMWVDAKNDEVCRRWARDLNERFKRELEKGHGVQTSEGGAAGGVAPRGKKGAVLLYGNYDQYDERSRDIFGENYARLQRLKARFDEGNLFGKLFPIVPDAEAVEG